MQRVHMRNYQRNNSLRRVQLRQRRGAVSRPIHCSSNQWQREQPTCVLFAAGRMGCRPDSFAYVHIIESVYKSAQEGPETGACCAQCSAVRPTPGLVHAISQVSLQQGLHLAQPSCLQSRQPRSLPVRCVHAPVAYRSSHRHTDGIESCFARA
jgi:hypothetical protein